MLPQVNKLIRFMRHVEWSIAQMFKQPPPEFAMIGFSNQQSVSSTPKFTLKDLVGDGFLLAVPKFRRTVEKRWKRKYGYPEYVWKPLVAKTNITACSDCGHDRERDRLCGNCFKKVIAETKEIQEKIAEKLGTGKPIENDVIVLYEGDNLPEKPQEFWQGKRIIEMKKERPRWFSKNLLQKTTQQPSNATDVKPTDLA